MVTKAHNTLHDQSSTAHGPCFSQSILLTDKMVVTKAHNRRHDQSSRTLPQQPTDLALSVSFYPPVSVSQPHSLNLCESISIHQSLSNNRYINPSLSNNLYPPVCSSVSLHQSLSTSLCQSPSVNSSLSTSLYRSVSVIISV